MNLPNKITIFRICIIPFFIFFMLMENIPYNRVFGLGIFIIACLSDALDGHIARKYHLITNFGKFMDPLADKILVCSALILFVAKGQLFSVIVIIIIARDFIISGFRLVASDSGIVLAASWWGKIKTTVMMVMCVLLILHLEQTWYYVLEQIFIYAALILNVVSLLDYLIKNKQVMSGKTE